MPKYWQDHIHLGSPDPAKTAEFYEEMFAASMVGSREMPDGRIAYIELSIDGMTLLISPRPQAESAPAQSGAASGLVHFGLRTDDIEAAATDLKSKGAEFTVEVREVRPGLKIAFVRAPEGVLIELVERKDQTA